MALKRSKRPGSRRHAMASCSSCFTMSTPATSLKVVLGGSLDDSRFLPLPALLSTRRFMIKRNGSSGSQMEKRPVRNLDTTPPSVWRLTPKAMFCCSISCTAQAVQGRGRGWRHLASVRAHGTTAGTGMHVTDGGAE